MYAQSLIIHHVYPCTSMVTPMQELKPFLFYQELRPDL